MCASRRYHAVQASVLRLVAGLGAVFCSGAQAVPWRIVTLTSPDEGVEGAPRVSDALVVWGRNGYGSTFEIVVHDGIEIVPLTLNAVDDCCPRVADTRVAWMRHDGNDWEIWFYDTANGLPGRTNGSAGAELGAALSVQNTQTQFGNSTLGLVDFANGSELDAAYGTIMDGALYLVLAGNLESNFNKLEIFIDSVAGQGQNRLRGDNPDVDYNGLNRMGDDGSGNGLTFDSGFEPDFYLTFTGGGSPYALYGSYAELLTAGGGAGYYLGAGGAATEGALSGGTNPYFIRATIDNRNTGGVTSGTGAGSGAGVTTGLELAIPLAALGNPAGSVRICAFVNGTGHDYVSNQILGPLGGGANLGEPRNVNFGSRPGDQFFTVSPAANGPIQLTNNAYGDSLMSMAGDYVTWTASDGNDLEVFLYDGAGVSQLSNNTVDDVEPHTDGNWVVWVRIDTGNDSDIVAYNGTNVFAITDDAYPISNDHPKVSDGQVIWWQWPTMGIFLYSGGEPTRLDPDYHEEQSPVISHGYAAWRSGRSFPGPADIIFYAGGSPIQLTNDDALDNAPLISGSLVVWSRYELSVSTLTVYDDDGVHAISLAPPGTFDVFGTRIAWLDGWPGDIYLAVPAPDLDADGDVDLTDYAAFAACLGGPGSPPPGGCEDADLDGDDDADLADFVILMECYGGAGARPACL
ncbi:MAG: hypothetical protein V2A79_09365 [Planctomycetota bacterium]